MLSIKRYIIVYKEAKVGIIPSLLVFLTSYLAVASLILLAPPNSRAALGGALVVLFANGIGFSIVLVEYLRDMFRRGTDSPEKIGPYLYITGDKGEDCYLCNAHSPEFEALLTEVRETIGHVDDARWIIDKVN